MKTVGLFMCRIAWAVGAATFGLNVISGAALSDYAVGYTVCALLFVGGAPAAATPASPGDTA